MINFKKIIESIPVHLILIFFAIIALIPIWIIFVSAIKPHVEVYKNQLALPNKIEFQFYQILITQGYYKNFLQSFYFASITTVITVIISTLAAYAFAIKVFFGKTFLFILVLLGLMISEISIIVPVYLMIMDLNLKNTLLGIIIPQVALGLSFGIFLLTTFFKEVPKELIEASVVDGCNDKTILYNVILPLSLPSIKALAVIEFLWAWNSFFFPLVLVQDTTVMPMSVRIIDFMGRYLFNYGGIATVCILMFIPIFVLYLISQSSFHRGITLGGLKG
jgi:raffinose/stachyose/melibiose transport system permease protein|tara:strand:- start:156 stop:986 length:831 start_codon:yes stop_codon:yes gene_type:complete